MLSSGLETCIGISFMSESNIVSLTVYKTFHNYSYFFSVFPTLFFVTGVDPSATFFPPPATTSPHLCQAPGSFHTTFKNNFFSLIYITTLHSYNVFRRPWADPRNFPSLIAILAQSTIQTSPWYSNQLPKIRSVLFHFLSHYGQGWMFCYFVLFLPSDLLTCFYN